MSKIDKYLIVKEHEIITKENAYIKIDKDLYKNYQEIIKEHDDKENEIVIVIPGHFELVFPDKLDSIKFHFPYDIEIVKKYHDGDDPDTLKYSPGDPVFYAEFASTNTNLSFISSMLDNRIKYLNDDIYQVILNIYNQFSKMNDVQLSHIELLVSNTYGTFKDGEFYPLRLLGKKYESKYAIDLAKTSHYLSNSMGFSFGYSNDYLLRDISRNYKKDKSYVEHILSGEFDKLYNSQKEIKEKYENKSS